MINKFILWAKKNNWNVILNLEKAELPNTVKNRYNIPEQWYNFICKLQICENQTATKWFLTPNDYQPHEDGFRWNEFEIQSLEYGDNENDITSYWNNNLPIIMSVDGEYSYYAINIESGNVVIGYEPEYEDSSVVAEDFNTFINKVVSGEIEL